MNIMTFLYVKYLKSYVINQALFFAKNFKTESWNFSQNWAKIIKLRNTKFLEFRFFIFQTEIIKNQIFRNSSLKNTLFLNKVTRKHKVWCLFIKNLLLNNSFDTFFLKIDIFNSFFLKSEQYFNQNREFFFQNSALKTSKLQNTKFSDI